MAIYFFKTIKEGSKNRLRPMPFQTFEDGRPLITNFNTQADMSLRNAYPIGTVFASEVVEERTGNAQVFYAAGDIFPVSVQRNELASAAHQPTDEMARAYTIYMADHAADLNTKDAPNEGVFADQKGRPLTLLAKLQSNPRFACPTIETDGFFVEEDVWWNLMVDMKEGVNVLFKGPAGSGKTELVLLACKKLGLDCHVYDMGSMYDPISDLLGVHRMTPSGSVFDYAQFTQDIQHEGVILLDELSRATPAVNNILMPVLDNRRTLRVEMAGAKDQRSIPVHPKCRFIATANIGPQYAGANDIDIALRDRHDEIETNYMPAQEEIKMLVKNFKIANADAVNIVNTARTVREIAAKGDIELPITTRETIRAAKKVAAGFSADKAMELCFLPRYEGSKHEGSRAVVWNAIISR